MDNGIESFNPWEEVRTYLLDRHLLHPPHNSTKKQRSNRGRSSRRRFPSKAYAQFLANSRKRNPRPQPVKQQLTQDTEFSGFSQVSLGASRGESGNTSTGLSLGSSSAQTYGAVAFDLSYLIMLELDVSTEELETKLNRYFQGIALKLYRERRRLWQGDTDELGTVYAFWLSSEKLVICVHELALSSIPLWLDETSRYTNLTAVDVIGAKALKIVAHISPSDHNLRREWLQVCSVPAPLIFTGSIAEFSTTFERYKPHKKVRPPKNLARSFEKLKPTASDQADTVRIVFLAPTHIRIYIDSTAAAPLWECLAISNQVRTGDQNEWKRKLADL